MHTTCDCVKLVVLTKKMAFLTLLLCIMLNEMFVVTSAIECPQMCDCFEALAWPGSPNYLFPPPTGYPFKSLWVDCGGRSMNESILAEELDSLLSDEDLRENLSWLNISNTPLTDCLLYTSDAADE